jgi:hypothetical protein
MPMLYYEALRKHNTVFESTHVYGGRDSIAPQKLLRVRKYGSGELLLNPPRQT